MRTISRSIAFALLPTLLSAAPYLCRNNNATYQTQAHCNTDCGTTCEELDPLASGTSGSCDTVNFEGFVYSNNVTYAITKSTQFWTDTANLALPKDEQINTILKGIASYYGGNAWIGVYDTLKSSNYNSVDPSRFKLSNGIVLTYSNWSSGQPDNKLDNADIGVTAINGEHWVYIQSDATWLDDGYHAIYGGDNKPKRKALAEWNGPLDCVSGTPKNTTSNTNGYYCGDGTGNVAQCTMGSIPSSSDACTLPATWDSASQKCKTIYTATGTSTTTTYAATMTTSKIAGQCEVYYEYSPYWYENTQNESCESFCTDLFRPGINSFLEYECITWKMGGYDYNRYFVRRPDGPATYSCPDGGTLSGSTCTTTTTTYSCLTGGTLSGSTCTIYQDPSCPSGTQLNTSTGQCQPISACTAPAVWNSTTQKCDALTAATYAATATLPSKCTLYSDYERTSCSANRPTSGYSYCGIGESTFDFNSKCEYKTYTGNINYKCSGSCIDGRDSGGNYILLTPNSAIAMVNSNYWLRNTTQAGSYACHSGGTLSGSTCTTTTTTSTSGMCPQNMTPDQATGYCATLSVCPLGNYQCALINSSTIENTDTTEGANDKTDNGQTDESGHCLGTLYIFNGNDNRCRPSGMQTGFTDCCQKGTTWFGLGQCKESEKTLGKLREFGSLDGNCHYVGSYCAEKWPLVGCVQKKKTYCCFSSPLARIIQEGGRPQLGIGWGSPEAPQCRGFTPEEFQKIDFSKVNFSEWIQYDVVPNVQNNAVANIQNVINNIDTNLAP